MATTLKRDPQNVIKAAIRTLNNAPQTTPEQKRKAAAALKRVQTKLRHA